MPTDPDQLIEDVGRRVGELRVQAGFTQAELADLAEVSPKYLQRIEAGQENLTLRSLARMANILLVPVTDLFLAPERAAPGRGRPPGKAK